MSGRTGKKEPGQAEARDRQDRSAAALRENLKRRKAQARLRQEAGGEGSCGGDDGKAGNRSA
ncbi:MAG: hypothetical protein ACTSUD_14730 [Alphaproteobacteria bacterium]